MFSYAAPSLSSVTGCTPSGSATIDCDVAGNYNIVINGANFGSTPSKVTVNIGTAPTITVRCNTCAISDKLTPCPDSE